MQCREQLIFRWLMLLVLYVWNFPFWLFYNARNMTKLNFKLPLESALPSQGLPSV